MAVEEKSWFEEAVEEVERWAKIIGKTAEHILETSPSKKDKENEK